MEQDYIIYKGKPLVRCDNSVYFGAPDDKYYISISLDEIKKSGKTSVANKAVIELYQNQNGINRKNKLIKRAQRDGLFAALDIGTFWLFDALSWK